MGLDQEWTRIFTMPAQQLEEQGARRWIVPAHRLPPEGPPKCPSHCAGTHHVDGEVQCSHCHSVMYLIIAHTWCHMDGHYFYSYKAVNGSPPEKPEHPVCTMCGGTRHTVRL